MRLQNLSGLTTSYKISPNHRFLKFSCWFPVDFVARLLVINTLPLSPSQKTDQPVENATDEFLRIRTTKFCSHIPENRSYMEEISMDAYADEAV